MDYSKDLDFLLLHTRLTRSIKKINFYPLGLIKNLFLSYKIHKKNYFYPSLIQIEKHKSIRVTPCRGEWG